MNEYINLTLENIDEEHICCAIGNPKHQQGVDRKKEWVKELTEYSKSNNIKINFIKIDSLEKAKNIPCVLNNWANFYKGEFVSNTILNANSFEKLIKE